ncbi:MAG: translation initiation factor IF-3 [Verrucomicrobiota bacterium]
MNERIRAPKIRVVDAESGKQLGVMQTSEALKVAKARGLDLVEVTSNTDPPVCRIVDYGKYKYEQKKKQKEHPKKTNKTKEVKFRVGIDPHDYEIKMTRAEHFLDDGDKLRVQLMFRGRQMAHQNIGFDLMKRVKEDLAEMAHVDMEPKLAGRNITMMMSPLPEHMRRRKFTKLDAEDYEGHEDEEDHEDDEEHDEEVENVEKEEKRNKHEMVIDPHSI